ncbi:exonuclease domain-containing protein [Salipiger marinus]|uniref:3'-5' exonuclease n=1 Tax=Salipiger marinus TaxID=555512 RepID=UPI001E5E7EDA|nr:exonuclease domain-containing protein [Salipiger manganoxidans]MCD1620628.1 3'-5' exonuclease [Salipiger manganoxidans]MEB3420963.1 exonuclease domain-containing protein [Salipiger manganoxidans]
MTRLSLRLRVFLFFAALALGGSALIGAALWLGLARAQASTPENGFAFAGIVAVLGLLALCAGIWLLFDENVARPIERIAAEMRARAHAGVDRRVDTHAARYLGDLAPAAEAVSAQLGASTLATAQRVAVETERLAAETARLTALLTEIPVAMMMVGPGGQIVLYDGQAAEVLAQIHVPRLNAPLSDYFDPEAVAQAVRRMHRSGREVALVLASVDGRQSYAARMRPLDGGGYLLTVDGAEAQIAPEAERPLVYDFDLLTAPAPAALEDTPLSRLVHVVFDTETTGLLPHKDEVVQIAAVRVVNGRIVPGEVLDLLVDPGMPIPPAATRVHRVTDAMVRGRPDIAEAGRRFHGFARGAVIVAHNAPFDMAFLRRHQARMRVVWDNPILDTVLLSAVLFGAGQPHTLDALCDRLGVTLPPALRHTALGDARATAEVLVRMLPMLEARGITTFGQVLEETRRHGRILADQN